MPFQVLIHRLQGIQTRATDDCFSTNQAFFIKAFVYEYSTFLGYLSSRGGLQQTGS